ncbi:MAG: hypothetical protein IT283_04800 [Bacteroidetes bacterium]|nr:hypothetical protein [Bacteroidota bacterium]
MKRSTAANIGLPQWGLTWLIQVQSFYQSLCLIDSIVLLNPPLRQAEKRWR